MITGSRDKNLIIWKVAGEMDRLDGTAFGEPYLSLTGHNHFVSDLSLSQDQNHLLSSSWDKSLRLWSLRTGKCIKRLSQHGTKEILSATFSSEGRQIFSSGCNNKLSLWNTKGEHILSSDKQPHSDWASKVRFSPSAKNKFYASVGWDGYLKVWTEFFKLSASVKAHESPIYALAITGNGYYIATGGKDQIVKLWKVGEFDAPQLEFKFDSNIVDLAFHPEMQWIAVATEKKIHFCDLTSESEKAFTSVGTEGTKMYPNTGEPKFTSIAWSSTGKYIYTGASDNLVRVFTIDVIQE